MIRFLAALLSPLLSTCLNIELFEEARTCEGEGAFVLAGGGAEGDIGDTAAWSYLLYRELVINGDVDQDGVVRVSILASDESDDPSFMPEYFAWIGETLDLAVSAQNVIISTRAEADAPAFVEGVGRSDVVFIKGGDQGVYYDQWSGTLLEEQLREVVACHGALGGTSAGAMSLSEFSFSGSRDLISEDVVADARTPFLDDEQGGSGIHTDFLSFLPGVLVDTHFTSRGRFARLMGILAKASDDHERDDILAIGIEERTGFVLRGGVAEVIGVGEVSLLQETEQTTMRRVATEPLRYTSLRLDRLTHGWRFTLEDRAPLLDALPEGVELVEPARMTPVQTEALLLFGDEASDAEKFEAVATIFPEDYSLRQTSSELFIEGAVGFSDAGLFDDRMDKQETLFRALYDDPGMVGFLVFFGGAIERASGAPSVLSFVPSGAGPEMATLIIDSGFVTHRGLSPFLSNWSVDAGDLRASALIGVRVHLLAASELGEPRFDLRDGGLLE